MSDPLKPADLSEARTFPLSARKSKIDSSAFATAPRDDLSFAEFLDGLSDVLAVRTLRGLASAVVQASRTQKPVIWACGGHVVKVGLAPVLIGMMERGLLSGLVLNGAAAIHDWEIASIGATSEDVAGSLADGSFGMAEETGSEFSAAAQEAAAGGEGLGTALGRRLVAAQRPYQDKSLLATAHRLGLPATVHVAIGSDVVHQHPAADGAAIGAASHTDFRLVVSIVSRLSHGVWINCGSAVQLPEVFLKAFALAANLGAPPAGQTMANLDMQRHYRTEQNILRRPTRDSGQAFNLIGHHEINVPLLAAAIELERKRTAG